jgi:hypothetical protein
MAVPTTVIAELLHKFPMVHGQTAVFLVQSRGEMSVLSAVTAVLLHHSALDIWTDCSVVSTG